MNNLTIIENELVTVYETSTGEKVVYGSELHEVLGVRTPYKDWSTRRLNDIDAVENEDFEAAQICAPSGQTKKDHIIKLDTAKEMAMLERNENGKEVRRYFIRVEKKYKAASLATQELSPQLQVMINLEIEQKRQAEKLEHVESRIESIREVVAIDTTSWRDDTGRILRKIGMECGDNKSYRNMRKRYKLFCSLATNVPDRDAWKDIDFTMSRNIPKNLLEEAQTAQALESIVSKETQLQVLSIVKDVTEEMDRMDKEEEKKQETIVDKRMFGGEVDGQQDVLEE